MLELFEATCDPSDTLPVGALIESAPAVSVKVAGVAAPAGNAVAAASAAKVLARSKSFRMREPFHCRAWREDEPHTPHRHLHLPNNATALARPGDRRGPLSSVSVTGDEEEPLAVLPDSNPPAQIVAGTLECADLLLGIEIALEPLPFFGSPCGRALAVGAWPDISVPAQRVGTARITGR